MRPQGGSATWHGYDQACLWCHLLVLCHSRYVNRYADCHRVMLAHYSLQNACPCSHMASPRHTNVYISMWCQAHEQMCPDGHLKTLGHSWVHTSKSMLPEDSATIPQTFEEVKWHHQMLMGLGLVLCTQMLNAGSRNLVFIQMSTSAHAPSDNV